LQILSKTRPTTVKAPPLSRIVHVPPCTAELQCCQAPPSLHCHFCPKLRQFLHLTRPHTLNILFFALFKSLHHKVSTQKYLMPPENSTIILTNLFLNVSFWELFFKRQHYSLIKSFHGHFDGHKFSRSFSFKKLPLLRKVAVTAANSTSDQRVVAPN
jgi:hypothetical protein